MCDMLHSYVWHDPSIWVTWLIHMCDMTHSCAWHDSFMCDMTLSHVWHDPSICVTWLIHMCDTPCLHVWHNRFLCVTRRTDNPGGCEGVSFDGVSDVGFRFWSLGCGHLQIGWQPCGLGSQPSLVANWRGLVCLGLPRTLIAALSVCAHVCVMCECVVYIHMYMRVCILLTTHDGRSPLYMCTCVCNLCVCSVYTYTYGCVC